MIQPKDINPTEMDSDEERQFYDWLIEAESVDLVSNIEYHPGSFTLAERASVQIEQQLKTKTKTVEKFLLHPHSYTPDFVFVWHGLFSPFFTRQNCTWVDVKGSFGLHGDSKQFRLNQKWMWARYGIYVNEVVPVKLFKKTWVPESCRWTPKQKKPVKKYVGCKTIDEFVYGIVESVSYTKRKPNTVNEGKRIGATL